MDSFVTLNFFQFWPSIQDFCLSSQIFFYFANEVLILLIAISLYFSFFKISSFNILIIEIWSSRFFSLFISPTQESILNNDRVTGRVG